MIVPPLIKKNNGLTIGRFDQRHGDPVHGEHVESGRMSIVYKKNNAPNAHKLMEYEISLRKSHSHSFIHALIHSEAE